MSKNKSFRNRTPKYMMEPEERARTAERKRRDLAGVAAHKTPKLSPRKTVERGEAIR